MAADNPLADDAIGAAFKPAFIIGEVGVVAGGEDDEGEGSEDEEEGDKID